MDDIIHLAEQEGLVVLKPDALEEMLERSAHRGAKRALESIGLHDDEAGADVRDLRTLIGDWRTVKTGMLRALGKLLLWVVIASVTAFGIKTGVLSGLTGK